MIILKEIKNKSIKLLINERLDEEEKKINEEMNYHHKKEVSLYNEMNYHHQENFRNKYKTIKRIRFGNYTEVYKGKRKRKKI